MKIHNDIEIVDLGLKYKDILVIGDLQLGYEQYLNERGVLVPRFQTNDTLERLRRILAKCEGVKKIIFNGDGINLMTYYAICTISRNNIRVNYICKRSG